ESATESLSPQFLVHVEENGRRYHPEPEKVSNYEHPYWAPNDEREQDRVDLSNHLWNLILPGLFLSPIRNPQSILDLGTGTGIWAIDVADEYPSAKVLGTDLSPIQPIWIPPNLKFTVDDFNHPPPGRDTIEGTWDFIHARELMGGVRYWPKLIEDSFQALEAGGWLELAEWNFHFLGEDVPPILNRWAETMIKAGEKNGMTFDMCGGLERWMKERGFVNVIKTTYQVPFGRWPADRKQRLLGNWNYLRLRMDVKGHCLRPMVRFLGMDKDQTDVQIAFIENAL
ncbi:S-adenosyl-L-methionine-dependent methyltransferase, partial [Cadophora sp. DSE1049]